MAVKLTGIKYLKRSGVRDALLVAVFIGVAIFLSFHVLSGWWGTKDYSDRIKSEETAILLALQLYKEANGGCPAGSSAKISGMLLGKNGRGLLEWSPRRIGSNNELLDVWGKPYLIAITSELVSVTSGGPDGVIGTSDDRGLETRLTLIPDSRDGVEGATPK